MPKVWGSSSIQSTNSTAQVRPPKENLEGIVIMAVIVSKKLVPAGKEQKTNWYHSRDREGYAKINKKHSLIGFVHRDIKDRIKLKRNPAYVAWPYQVRNNFNSWMVTYDQSHRAHPQSGVGQFSLELRCQRLAAS